MAHATSSARGASVRLVIWLATSLSLAGVYALFLRPIGSDKVPLAPTSWQALAPMFAGTTINLGSSAGIRVFKSHTVAGSAVALSRMESGALVRVDLCLQRGGAAQPGRIRPQRLMTAFDPGRDGKSSDRQTVIVGPTVGQSMPELIVSGWAGVFGRSSPAPPPLDIQWRANGSVPRVVSDAVLVDPVAPGDAGDTRDTGSARERDASFVREAWVLWDQAEDDGLSVFLRGLRLRRVSDASCPLGAIEVLGLHASDASTVAASGQEVSTDVARELGAGVYGEPGAVRQRVLLLQPGEATRELLLAPGSHMVPVGAAQPMEDHALFSAAVAAGLIRIEDGGKVAVTPRDARQDPATQTQWTPERIDLHKRLYRHADGAYVREEIERFNQSRLLAAARVTAYPEKWAALTAELDPWSSTVDGIDAALQSGVAPQVARLQSLIPDARAPWVSVANWPQGSGAQSVVRLTLRLPQPAMGGETVSVMLLGRLTTSVPAAISKPLCSTRACPEPSTLSEAAFHLVAGQRQIEIELAPTDALARLGYSGEHPGNLRMKNRQLAWIDLPRGTLYKALAPATVTLRAADGSLLFTRHAPTALAQMLGVVPLVGLDNLPTTGIAATLARLPTHSVEATLSIDPHWQRLATQSLACVGHLGRNNANQASGDRESTCEPDGRVPPQRRSALILLDADTGDIVAAAAQPQPLATMRADDLTAFDRYHPAQSLLRWPGWHHDGGPHWAPGSSFKVVDALAFESAARTDVSLERLLDGASATVMTVRGAANDLAFDPGSACYPAPCVGSKAQVENYRQHRPVDYASQGRFGVTQALTHSLNTWFAWLAEDTDLAGRLGQVSLRALEPTSLMTIRPVQAMAHRLGFGQVMLLDGGLLPPNVSPGDGDTLRASASQIDPLDSLADVRRMAIGLRMQATPLQMARVAAAVGSGSVVTPRLIAQLAGQRSVVRTELLNVRLDRIRAGMYDVVEHGTAAGVFKTPALKRFVPGIAGKTGTAPHADGIHNNAWFIGWIEPGTLPGQTRRLAFAVMVSHTFERETGGSRAAAVVADMLLRHLDESSR
jgi:cell division protein FtsI/penicillin-binding protein 2